MKKLVAFAASNSKQSINKQLATWAANQVTDVEVNVLDLNDYEMPIFSVDRENESGIPQLAHDFKDQLRAADGIVISFAEHNSNVSAAFKNIFDWASRIEQKMWLDKPMFLMATSPGPRGGATVLDIVTKGFPFRGAGPISSFSLPSFSQNFDNGIINEEELSKFNNELKKFEEVIYGQKAEV